MFIRSIEPAVCDTDCLGHINNTRLPIWFEYSRNDIFHIFNPDLDNIVWNILTARIEVDYLDQIFFPHNVEIRTWISHIGNSSFTVSHAAVQHGSVCATGKAVMVHVDPVLRKSVPLSTDLREKLTVHFIKGELDI